MVSEVVMYQSMFVLGIIMFAFFTVTFNNYTDFAEEITIDTNMERVLQEVGQEILDLISHGRNLKGRSSNITSSIHLSLESEYGGQAYQLQVVPSADNTAMLTSSFAGETFSEQSLGTKIGTNPDNGEIQFSGQLSSGDVDPVITYQWDSINNIEQITFS